MKTSIRLFFGVILLAITYLSACKKDSSTSEYPINLKVTGHDTDYTVWIHGRESTSDFPVSYFFNPNWIVYPITEISFLNDTQYTDNRYGSSYKFPYFFRNDSFFRWQMPSGPPESSQQRVAVLMGLGNRQKLTMTYSNSTVNKLDTVSIAYIVLTLPWRMTKELWIQMNFQSEMPDTLAIYNYTEYLK